MVKSVKKTILDYIVLTFAAFIFAVSWECFMIPNGMSAGGLMGLCTIVQYATGGLIEAQFSYVVVNTVLIIIAVMAMGIGFGFKTIYCIALTTVMMEVVSNMGFIHCEPGGFFFIQERVLIPLIAGVLEALGVGLILKYGGSTGGTDILALMINKYWPVSLSKTFLISDLVICSLLLFLPDKNFSDMCYGLEMMVAFSLVIDVVVGGKRSSYQLLIFSDRFTDIADEISTKVGRGVTVIKSIGWYSKADKNVLLVLINQKELPTVTKLIKEIDNKAFMSISPTNDVYGEGFEEIKAGVTKKKKQ
ncbi:MAG: YitT family protein [Bacteroidales bacterium]|nr:YitT family protein [Bacteroidales bacterium]